MVPLFFDLPTLETLFSFYEQSRARAGLGTALYHVTPRQRVDALEICVSLYASGRAPPADDREGWLRHLTPVLAETRESARAFEAAFDRLAETGIQPTMVDSPPGKKWWRRLRDFMRWGWSPTVGIPAAAVAVVLIGLSGIAVWFNAESQRPAHGGSAVADVPPADVAAATDASGRAQTDPLIQAFALTLNAARDHDWEITPRELARTYAAELLGTGSPASILVALLRYRPNPPDQPIARTPDGLLVLGQFAATITAMKRGVDPIALATAARDLDMAALARNGVSGPAASFLAASNATTTDRTTAVDAWPRWVFAFPLLALLPGSVWAFRGLRRMIETEGEAALARPVVRAAQTGETARAAIWQTSPVMLPALPYAGATARRLGTLRESRPGKVFDAPRSLRATIASGGDLTAMMLPASRIVDPVFLVHRRHANDHERARFVRDLAALDAAGIFMFIYDYGPDLRTIASADGGRSFDLRALRDLHGDALLVVVSDGQDLIDTFTHEPLAVVARELRTWPRRMLLTSSSTRDWGEREMKLARAFGGPIGRATMAGLGDLALGLEADQPDSRFRRILADTAGRSDYFEQIDAWADRAAALVARDTIPRRPPLLRFDDPALLVDPGPPADSALGSGGELTVPALIAALRRWLGPAGFIWFAGCAAYPQLRFDITLWLGTRLMSRGSPVFSERLLAQLSALPWFRIGRMPDWLRVAAFDALAPAEQRQAREAIDELLRGENHGLYWLRTLATGLPPDRREKALAVLDELAAGESGNAPWLLEVGLRDCSTTDRERAEADIRNHLRARILSLPVWYPDSKGQAVTPDDVMIGFKHAEGSRKETLQVARAKAVERWAVRGFARVGAIFLWACVAIALMPRPADAPNGYGAWWPLVVYLAVSVAVVALMASRAGAALRQRLARPAADWRQAAAGART